MRVNGLGSVRVIAVHHANVTVVTRQMFLVCKWGEHSVFIDDMGKGDVLPMIRRDNVSLSFTKLMVAVTPLALLSEGFLCNNIRDGYFPVLRALVDDDKALVRISITLMCMLLATSVFQSKVYFVRLAGFTASSERDVGVGYLSSVACVL